MKSSKTNINVYLKNELPKIIGRKLNKKDGLSENYIKNCEDKKGLSLPVSLRYYYLIAGKLAINREHNLLYGPNQIDIFDEMLVFMEENQRVVFWGFKIDDIENDDPLVYQGINSKPREWYSEKIRFSKFVIKMWNWQKKCIKNTHS